MAAPTASSTTALSAGTSTRAALVARVLRRIEDNAVTDTHSDALNSSVTAATIASDGTKRYQAGHTIDWQDDGTFESALITAAAATSLTIRRAHRGTTAAAHAAAAVFRVNPRFLSHVIAEYVDEAVNLLWPDIPSVFLAVYSVASSNTDLWYALPAGAEEVYQVYQLPTSTPQKRTSPSLVSGPHWFDSTFVTTKKALYIEGLDSATSTMNVVYGQKPAVTELTSAQQDIVVYSAARIALETETGHRPTRDGDRNIFGSDNKISFFRREEDRIRGKEMARMANYFPRRSSMIWRSRHDYTEV